MKKKISVQKYMVLNNIPSALAFICLGISMQFTSKFIVILAIIGVIFNVIPVVTTLIYFKREKREYEDELVEINKGKSSRISIGIIHVMLIIVALYCVSTETTILLSPSTILYMVAILQILKVSTFMVYEKMEQL